MNNLIHNNYTIIKDYYNPYLDYVTNSNISIDKFLYQIQINKTLHTFVELCIFYNICLIYINHNTLYIKTNKMLLDECNKIKNSAYTKCIIKLYELMNNDNEWIDTTLQIDKNIDDLKKILKDIDLLQDLLINVYTDISLAQQFQRYNNEDNINSEIISTCDNDIIEEFSNKIT